MVSLHDLPKEHLRTMTISVLIALVGLAAGGIWRGFYLAGVSSAKSELKPSPIAAKAKISPQPSQAAVVISLTPSPSVSPKPSSKVSTKPTASPAKPNSRGFNWGVTMLPFPLREKNDIFLAKQFDAASQLGVKVIRIDYVPNNPAMNQEVVRLGKQYGIKIAFIIPFGPKDIFSDSQLSQDAHDYVYDIVSQYKGQVPIWQLATEPGSVALSNGKWGVATTDYDSGKYQAVSTWLKAATEAVKQADPNAQRMVNDQWIHVGFFDRFIKDGGQFEILGWNWYSDMGTNMVKPVIDPTTHQTYALMDKLESYKKDIWLTEVNRRMGNADGNNKAAADFIMMMARFAYQRPSIKGFVVFDLIGDQAAPPQEKGYGLAGADTDLLEVRNLTPAFGQYQAFIRQSP